MTITQAIRKCIAFFTLVMVAGCVHHPENDMVIEIGSPNPPLTERIQGTWIFLNVLDGQLDPEALQYQIVDRQIFRLSPKGHKKLFADNVAAVTCPNHPTCNGTRYVAITRPTADRPSQILFITWEESKKRLRFDGWNSSHTTGWTQWLQKKSENTARDSLSPAGQAEGIRRRR